MQRYEQNALLMVILMKSTFITHTQTNLIYKNSMHTKCSVQNLVKLVTYVCQCQVSIIKLVNQEYC